MRISWEQLSQNIESCQACALAAGCLNKVPGQGDPHAPLMQIGVGPCEQEDRQGLAFVGPAGQLLTRMLAAISLPRDRVYICSVVKCRPPNNRQPTPEEVAACLPHLRGQVALVRPRVILLLGATAVAAVLGPQERGPGLDALRAVTINAAYQYFEEGSKGSLRPGKRADLVILEEDTMKALPMHLRDIRILETVKDGKTIYRTDI